MAKVKVAYNNCFGGFGLSKEGLELYNKKRDALNLPQVSKYGSYVRHDVSLIEVIEELGTNANGKYSELRIYEIPNEYMNCYYINEYDGKESVQCDRGKLIKYKYLNLNVDELSDLECRDYLKDIVRILSS
jgi:hypothetical protein